MRWLIAWIAAAAVYCAGDFTWVSVMGPRIYRPVIGALLADRFDIRPGLAYYLIYVTGIVAFGVAPGLRSGGWSRALGWGALLGLVAYAAYDLTNQATLKVWSTGLSVIDIAWGAAITGFASGVGCLVASLASRR